MRITTYKTMLCQDTNHNVLVKDMSVNYPSIDRLDSPEKIVEVMNSIFHMDTLAEEYVYLIVMNTKCALLGVFEISHGTVNTSLMNPREVLIKALLCSGVSCALIHNHPSGDSTPSSEDIKVTKRLKEVFDLVGLTFMDHLIIGNAEYLSFKEKGLL